MKLNKFNRNLAFSMNIQDPDSFGDKSAIVYNFTIDNKSIIFKSSAIHQLLTADTIDPQKQHPETRHSHEKLYSIGTNNSYVARMIIQFKEILGLTIRDNVLKEKLLSHVWKANRLLLECESSHYSIYKDVMELMPRYDEIIEVHKTKQTIPALPKVGDLEKHVESFLNNGKLFLIAAYEILHIMYQMPFKNREESHFDKHREWIKNKFGANDPIFLLLDQDKDWVNLVSNMRNAIPHSAERYKVEIENITIKPGNKFSPPGWRYDITKNALGKQIEFSDLIYDLNVYLNNFLTFFEGLLILCVKKELDNQHSFLDVYRIKEEDIRPECPIVYIVNKK